MNNKKSLLGNFMEYATGSAITLILGFFSSPIITRLINPEELGKYSMFSLFIGISAIILTLGLDQSFVRFYYNEDRDINRYVLLRETVRIPILFCIVYIIIILINGRFISEYLFQENSIEAVLEIIINCFIMVINRYAILVVRMKQNGRLYSVLQIIQKAVYILFSVGLCIVGKRNYIILIRATLIANVIMTLIPIISYWEFWFKKIEDSIKLKVSRKEIISYGFPFLFTLTISWAFQSADKISIKQFCNYSEIGIYASAFSIIALLNQLQTTFITFWTPVSYEHLTNNSDDREFFVNIFNITSIIMFFITVNLILFKDLVVYLLGAQYREASLVMPFLIFMPLMNTVSEVTVIGINFMKKTKYHIYIALGCCIFNVIGNLILVPRLGAKGAAFTTGVTYIIFFIVRTKIANNLYDIKFQLKKFYILTALTFILSIYATFNKADIVLVIFSIAIIVLIIILYKNILLNYYILIKNKFINKGKEIEGNVE